MRRVLSFAGSAIFLVLAPGTVAGLIPWWISRWRPDTPALAALPFPIVGGVLAAAGAVVLLDSFARFALQGLGTPAPVFPTRNLVVSGLYRFVRNPMYLALLALIVGQGLLFANVSVIVYGALVWLARHVFVLLYEEPVLRARFGSQYVRYCMGVRRWIPRLNRWPGQAD